MNHTVIVSFNPINRREFPGLDFDATYRRTLKLKVIFPGLMKRLESLEAYTNSVWQKMAFKVEWGPRGGRDWDGYLEVYNGELIEIKPLRNIDVLSAGRWTSRIEEGGTGSMVVTVWYARNDDRYSYDKTIVTFRTRACDFSILVEDLERGDVIFIEDFDVIISRLEDGISLEDCKREIAERREKTNKSFYDLIFEMPEQTLRRAWKELPRKAKNVPIVLGCEGRRQKFRLEPNGDVYCFENWIRRVKGRYSDRLLWDGPHIVYGFGFPPSSPISRYREDGYLPIIHNIWFNDGVFYEQEVFAILLFRDVMRDLGDWDGIDGDDPVVLMMKIALRCSATSPRHVKLTLTSRCSHEEALDEVNGFVYATNYEKPRLRYYIERPCERHII